MIQINSTLQNQLLIGCIAIFLSACSSIDMQRDMQSSSYNVLIHRDFWGIPYIRGETDLDVAYGIGLSHAEDSYDDLVELMPLYRGESALFNGLKGLETDYLVRLLRVHQNVEEIAKNQLSEKSLNMAQAYADGSINLLEIIQKSECKTASYYQRRCNCWILYTTSIFAGLDRDLAVMSNHVSTEIPTGSNAIAVNGAKSGGNLFCLSILTTTAALLDGMS